MPKRQPTTDVELAARRIVHDSVCTLEAAFREKCKDVEAEDAYYLFEYGEEPSNLPRECDNDEHYSWEGAEAAIAKARAAGVLPLNYDGPHRDWSDESDSPRWCPVTHKVLRTWLTLCGVESEVDAFAEDTWSKPPSQDEWYCLSQAVESLVHGHLGPPDDNFDRPQRQRAYAAATTLVTIARRLIAAGHMDDPWAPKPARAGQKPAGLRRARKVKG
jgi:hypothetical protein